MNAERGDNNVIYKINVNNHSWPKAPNIWTTR